LSQYRVICKADFHVGGRAGYDLIALENRLSRRQRPWSTPRFGKYLSTGINDVPYRFHQNPPDYNGFFIDLQALAQNQDEIKPALTG
jgi:hypothetical protein